VPGLLTLLGATLLVAGALLARVRKVRWRIVSVVALYVATVVAYYGVHTWDDRPSWINPVAVTTAIALLAGGRHGARLRRRPLPPESTLQVPLRRSPTAAIPRSIAASPRLPKPRTSSGG
jgi:peptidoglycan/LPS O-acetylase OafA/YrhL